MVLRWIAWVGLGLALSASPAWASGVLVRQHGAKCDGIADDSIAIKAAITAAGAYCYSDSSHQMHNQSYIELPNGSARKTNSGLQFNAACGWLVSTGGT